MSLVDIKTKESVMLFGDRNLDQDKSFSYVKSIFMISKDRFAVVTQHPMGQPQLTVFSMETGERIFERMFEKGTKFVSLFTTRSRF